MRKPKLDIIFGALSYFTEYRIIPYDSVHYKRYRDFFISTEYTLYTIDTEEPIKSWCGCIMLGRNSGDYYDLPMEMRDE